MPINLPNIPTGMDEFLKQIQQGTENRAKQQQMDQENQYKMGTLKLEQEKQPLNMEYIKSQIAANNALATQRQSSPLGGHGTKEQKELAALFSQAIADDPSLDNEQAKAVINAQMSGSPTLPDGTPTPKPSPQMAYLIDKMKKSTTTAMQINQALTAKQAAAEMPVYKKVIDQGIKNYGDTGPFEISAKQIADSLKTDDPKAQRRLGEYLAAQQLLYDRAALSLKINSLPPGVTVADEIKKLSYGTINAKFPQLSSEARLIAADIVSKALEDGLKARQSVGINAGAAFNTSQPDQGESGAQSSGTDQSIAKPTVQWKVVGKKLVKV